MSTWVQKMVDADSVRALSKERIDQQIAKDIQEFFELTGLRYDGKGFWESRRIFFDNKDTGVVRSWDIHADVRDISQSFLFPEFQRMLREAKP